MATRVTSDARKSRILFGSCNSQEFPQPLWPVIASRNATAFVWAGDAIYADHVVGMDYSTFPPHAIIDDATPERLQAMYEEQKAHRGYQALLRQGIYITGTFDDHDYGTNNGDVTYKYKRESAMAFLDFVQEPKESPMAQRARNGHGLYGVKLFDFGRPAGSQVVSDEEAGIDPNVTRIRKSPLLKTYSDRSVAVFVLDVRSFKTPWNTGKDKYHLNIEGDFLGERQWKWLEEALKRSKAAVHVVLQGLQVHADRFPDGNVAENWAKFPQAQERLYNLLLKHDTPTILVSGDVHMSELMRKDCKSQRGQKSLVEVTTSGMTHSWGTRYCSRPSFSYLCRSSYANWVFRNGMHFAHYINPLYDIIVSDQGELQYSLELNFAEFEFDWVKNMVDVKIIGRDGTSLLTAEWPLDELNKGLPGSKVRDQDYVTMAHRQETLGLPQTEWICVNHRGIAHPYHVAIGIIATWMFPLSFLFGPMAAAIVLGTILVMRVRKKR